MTALLEARAVTHIYPDGRLGLKDCSLQLRAGSRNAILGSNGAGKTTLLLHLNGILQPSSGTLFCQGQAFDYGRSGLRALRAKVGLVFQNPDRQLFSAVVEEDVSFGPLNLGLDAATVRQRVQQSLKAVGMQAHARRMVHHLSFGQKKRVCLAGVLAMEPELLLLDEPMAGLDVQMQAELAALLNDLAARGVTILLSTHDVEFAYQWADEIHLLREGQCLASGAAADIVARADLLQSAGLNAPVALALHAELSALGVLPSVPAARSLQDLLAQLRQHPSHPLNTGAN